MRSSSVKQFLSGIRRAGRCRAEVASARSMGRNRLFYAYDSDWDTFVFEQGVWPHLDEHASVLIVAKGDLVPHMRGYVMTVTTGNHAVAAMPLLAGKFWNLCALPPAKMSPTLSAKVITANVVDGRLEISQRDVATERVVLADRWLTHDRAWPLDAVQFRERNDGMLRHCRARGEEWRVRPLAWTEKEMRAELDASRKRLSTELSYFHSARGVHFLTLGEFRAFAARARNDYAEFTAELEELAGVYEGADTSFMRQPKIHGHHEIELFGLNRRVAPDEVVVRLEKLLADIRANRVTPAVAARRVQETAERFRLLLTRPELADETSGAFVESLYMHLTGEIYVVAGDGTAPAFDDRRQALPGATFSEGVPAYHPGADPRTEMLLSNVRWLLNKDERIASANVYELRPDGDEPQEAEMSAGEGKTREVVVRTNLRPLEISFIEKRIDSPEPGYGAYVLARIGAFKALGVFLPEYRMLHHRAIGGRRVDHDHYIRTRIEGDPLWEIPKNLFHSSERDRREDPDVLAQLAFLMGSAAAQNMVMKKYAADGTCLYGTGKEIYSFKWNTDESRYVPAGVWFCSIRGSCGWPDVSTTERNFQKAAQFYMPAYADTLGRFARVHGVRDINRLAERFLSGFRHRTGVLAWKYTVQKDEYDRFAPKEAEPWGFSAKWKFVRASLLWQEANFRFLKILFLSKLK